MAEHKNVQRESQLLKLLREYSPAQRVIRAPDVDMGLKESEPFPFLAVIGQREMKLALLLSVINPRVGGVLLIGSRGTAKTTAVRSLVDLLPTVSRSLCPNNLGCNEQMIELGGMSAVCKDCATKFGYNEPLTEAARMKLTELPLNARIDDVVGGINERAAMERKKIRLDKGILAQADNNILYIDEVNLLDDAVIDAILDASAQGFYTVRRGPHRLTYRSRFVLIGSMNPEEGRLRPQIMDRFGLRAIVRGLHDPQERYDAYELALWHQRNSESLSAAYAEATLQLAQEVQDASDRLADVIISEEAKLYGLEIVQRAQIESNRAEITLFEAARAHAAADERLEVLRTDIEAVALLALRQRQSAELLRFFETQHEEDAQLEAILETVQPPPKKRPRKKNTKNATTEATE